LQSGQPIGYLGRHPKSKACALYFTVSRNGTPANPTYSLNARTVIGVGETFTAQVEARDPNGPVYFALRSQPTGMTIDARTGFISFTPTAAQITTDPNNPYQYFVDLSDTLGGPAMASIGPMKLTVLARLSQNHAPTIDSDPTGLRASGDSPLIYQAHATDPDNDSPLIWSMLEGPVTAGIHPRTGEFTWLPGDDELGRDQTVVIQVTDPGGLSSTQEIGLRAGVSFVPGNAPPRIDSTPPLPGGPGQTYTYIVRAVDDDGDRLTFSIGGVEAANLTLTQLDNNTAQVVWQTPAHSDPNPDRDFIVTVTDARNASASQRVQLTLGTTAGGSVDTPPLITSSPVYSVQKGQTYRYDVNASTAPQEAIA